MLSTEQIVEGCKAGKRKAQNLLYRTYASQMFGVCLRYGKDVTEAEDMLQEGFIKVFQNIAQYRGTGPLQAWIRRIVVNTAINYIKRNARYKMSLSSSETEMVDIPDEGEEELYQNDPEMIMALIRDLPDGYRMVLNLFVFEAYTHKEIATMLGISESTSKTQLFKARESLKKSLTAKVIHKETISNGQETRQIG